MKILIVSDSHGNNEALIRLIEQYPNMDLYLHLGDSESDSYRINPFTSVKGNCDYYDDFPEYIIINTPLGKMLLHHKPYGIESLFYKEKIKIVLYGHTHKRDFSIHEGRYWINPGAISFSRDGNEGSYLILEISDEITPSFKSL